jgi:hypothetical protein
VKTSNRKRKFGTVTGCGLDDPRIGVIPSSSRSGCRYRDNIGLPWRMHATSHCPIVYSFLWTNILSFRRWFSGTFPPFNWRNGCTTLQNVSDHLYRRNVFESQIQKFPGSHPGDVTWDARYPPLLPFPILPLLRRKERYHTRSRSRTIPQQRQYRGPIRATAQSKHRASSLRTRVTQATASSHKSYDALPRRTQERTTENTREGVERGTQRGGGHAYWSRPAWGTGNISNGTRNARTLARHCHCHELWRCKGCCLLYRGERRQKKQRTRGNCFISKRRCHIVASVTLSSADIC